MNALKRSIASLTLAGLAALPAGAAPKSRPKAPAPKMVVYKSPTCGCCSKWVDHLKANGFEVSSVDVPDVAAIKKKQGVPAGLESCHTGIVGGYFVEGHVPADAVKKFLARAPKGAKGLAVPGMPIGSPGMEGPEPERYDVLLVKGSGGTEVFEKR